MERRRLHLGLTITMYEGNAFGVKFNHCGARVLVDPWLVGDLTFFEQSWAYVGRKRALGAGGAGGAGGGGSGNKGAASSGEVNVDEVAAETDLILLSQYLDDHTHMPTLRALPKSIPVIAQAEAAERIKPLGFSDVRVIRHGETVDACAGRLRVSATAGALVGPPWSERQNGFVVREAGGDRPASLYYEPHCGELMLLLLLLLLVVMRVVVATLLLECVGGGGVV